MPSPRPNHVAACGAIYATGASTAQSSIGTSYVKVTGFVTEGAAVQMDLDVANDQIKVRLPGKYLAQFQASISAATASTVFTFALSVDGTEAAYKTQLGTTATTAEDFVVSCVGLLDLTAGEAVYVEVKADGASKSITPAEMQLVLVKVG